MSNQNITIMETTVSNTKNALDLTVKLRGAIEKAITIYCPYFGPMRVKSIDDGTIRCYAVDDEEKKSVVFDKEGYMLQSYFGREAFKRSFEPVLFPDETKSSWDNFSIDNYPDLPSSWEEFSSTSEQFINEIKTKNGKFPYSDEIKALQMLLILRDQYRKADNAKEMKYNIVAGEDGKLRVAKIFNNQISIISFQNDILAEKFLKSFGGLLESARSII
jgi:hypothetical protein